MNATRLFGFVTAVALLSAALVGPGCSGGGKKDVTVGVILPLTGEGAVWGKNSQKGIELAVEQINADAAMGVKVKTVVEDSRTDAKSAVAAFQKLITQYGIKCAVVDMISADVLAMAPIANENKVVIISPGASSPEITKAGPYVFRNWPSDALQGVVNAQYAAIEMKWKRAGIVYVMNAYGEGLKDAFTAEFQKRGGQVVDAEGIKQGASDARSQLAKIIEANRSSKLDGVYLAIYPTEHPVVLRQMKQLNVGLPLLATESFEDPSITKMPAAEGVVYSVPAPADSASTAAKGFRKAFKEKFGEDPGITADVAFDALKLLVGAIKAKGNDGAKIQAYMEGVQGYDGAGGVTSFDKNGDVIKPFLFKVVKGGVGQSVSSELFVPKPDSAK
jgi:branched-chain amino acid transport system substrate-binding protein